MEYSCPLTRCSLARISFFCRDIIGFASLGSLASEVSDPGRSLLRVTIVLIPIIILVYVVPLLAALSQDNDYSHYRCELDAQPYREDMFPRWIY